MLVKLATENAQVNPIDLPVTSDLDPKWPANQHALAIHLYKNIDIPESEIVLLTSKSFKIFQLMFNS